MYAASASSNEKTYCAKNILVEENELAFLMAEATAGPAQSLLRVNKHCLQRHCMREAGRLQRPHLTHAKVSAGGRRCPILLSPRWG